MSNFQKYSAFYDLLYRDKDYAAEARYVAAKVRSFNPSAQYILELGSGTGRHGRLLAEMGFDVYGVERSPEMVSVANAHNVTANGTQGSFSCEVGDVCTANLGRTFDAVISLFHVVSYQTSDAALRAAFQVAADHLAPGAPFLFDVWHAPAVVAQRPSERVKELADERHRVRRIARPMHNEAQNTINVVYELECEDRLSGKIAHFSEEHLMRYLFPAEIIRLAEASHMRCVDSEEFLTGRPPSASTWGVAYVLQKIA